MVDRPKTRSLVIRCAKCGECVVVQVDENGAKLAHKARCKCPRREQESDR